MDDEILEHPLCRLLPADGCNTLRGGGGGGEGRGGEGRGGEGRGGEGRGGGGEGRGGEGRGGEGRGGENSIISLKWKEASISISQAWSPPPGDGRR